MPIVERDIREIYKMHPAKQNQTTEC